MDLQLVIVYAIVLSALIITATRLVRFFIAPASKCDGCSGCKLTEIKAGIKKM
jgi:hypothetical protein